MLRLVARPSLRAVEPRSNASMPVVLFSRTATPVRVWPGRRAFAALDALVWPALAGSLLAKIGTAVVLLGGIALCAIIATARLRTAVAANERYHFTTVRIGRWFGVILAAGLAAKAVTMLIAA